jgi:hypothetical protein
MDLQDVRKFVRKGDDATQLLESLGYSYESYQNAPPKWIKVKADPLQPVYDAVGKLMEDIQAPLIAKIKELTEAADIQAGERFVVGDLRYAPAGHTFRRRRDLWEGRYFIARCVEKHSVHGHIVRFGTGTDNTGFWLPVKAVTKA